MLPSKLVKLPEPVEVLLGFDSAPLPDAIETLLYRIDRTDNPSGIERYAAALMSEIDLPACALLPPSPK